MKPRAFNLLLVSFVLAIYYLLWGLLLKDICIPSEAWFEKTNYFIVSSYKSEIPSWLGTGSYVLSSQYIHACVDQRLIQDAFFYCSLLCIVEKGL